MPKKTKTPAPSPALKARALRAGVLTEYTDGLGQLRAAPAKAVAALCDAVEAHQPSEQAAVAIATVGARTLSFDRQTWMPRSGRAVISLEDQGQIDCRIEPAESRTQLRVRCDRPIPLGTHRLDFNACEDGTVHILCRPQSLSHLVEASGRRLALFLPLYAVHADRRAPGRFGVGTYDDLKSLCDWSKNTADALVGTLPLFPAFLDKPFEPSPYAPATRQMWNELFVDVRHAREWTDPRVQRAAREARATNPTAGRFVDYRASWSAARRVLRPMAEAAFATPARWAEVLAHVNTETARYALFRAANDATGKTWEKWPAAWRAGRIDPAKVDPRDVNLYIYAQSLANEQMAALRRSAGAKSPLYLDLPVGVHARGYDTWTRPDLFLQGFSAGAPADALNTDGQLWGFPPMHPLAGRVHGYAHLRTVLRRMLEVAGVLRIDHVMGLYRMFCTVDGDSATQGTYLRYPEEEWFAVVMIEAARAGAVVVGEDLGTVPPPVRTLMKSTGMLGMHVQQFSFSGSPFIQPAGPNVLACLNTHDTPTFAGYWHAADIRLRKLLRQTDAKGRDRENLERRQARRKIKQELAAKKLPSDTAKQAALSLMRLQAKGPSPITLVNLEDLWGERDPQNVPGTNEALPNWRQRAAKSLTQITQDNAIAKALAILKRDRASGRRRAKA